MITYSMKNNSLVQGFMKANLEKFQFMILSKTRCPEYNLSIDSNVMSDESESNESARTKLLELAIDNNSFLF